MIAVVDYGAGNLRSVANTLEALGASYTLVDTAEELGRATKIVLPGVGHFGQMMRALDDRNLRGPLLERVGSGVPFLGICLGMQALFEGSAEAPEARGLGIFPGSARRFAEGMRVPHMGWNQLRVKPGTRLFGKFTGGGYPWFYFAHSYYIPETEVSAAWCDYSLTYSAAIERNNVFGVQFHPEKSSVAGQKLVGAFLEL